MNKQSNNFRGLNKDGKLALSAIQTFAASQGCYGRLLRDIHADTQAAVPQLNVTGKGCRTITDVIMKMETGC